MHIVADILIIAIIVFCAWQGYKRGILGGILAVAFLFVSVWGAGVMTGAFANEFTSMFRPFISGWMDRVEVEAAEEVVPLELVGRSTEDIFRLDPNLETVVVRQAFLELGVHESRTDQLVEKYLEARDRGEYVSFNQAMTEVSVNTFCFLMVYIIAFLLILIALTVIYNVIHLSFKIPSLKLVDDIGGGILGLVQGLFLVFMLSWALGYAGLLLSGFGLPEYFLEQTSVVEFFVRQNTMGAFIEIS